MISNENLPIRHISVHCSDTPDSKDFSVEDIDKWHRAQGWAKVGYTYVVRRNGDIQPGRLETEVPAAVYGHNKGSLAVCWIGRNQSAPEQYLTLVHLIACLCRKHNLTQSNVKGHREYPDVAKSCPNLDCDILRKDVAFRLAEMQDRRISCGRTGAVCNCRKD